MRSLILFVFISTFLVISSCSNDDSEINEDEISVNSTTLSDDEIADLYFLREEEKLARDVYLYSYNIYNLQIFKNISNSEQSHMDNVLKLLISYNLEDSASNVIGEFNNPELQEIYNNLIQQSSISIIEALTVGNVIEDLDINDLLSNEERTTKTDLLLMYGSLRCGSRNHLRNYYSQLVQEGGTYTPIYITSNDFEEIINSENEKCSSN